SRAGERSPPPGLDTAPQWDGRVGELFQARPGTRRDDLARSHLVLGAVHGVHGDQLAAPEITSAEAALAGVASHDDRVMVVAQADDDELQIVLVRPEPRHF